GAGERQCGASHYSRHRGMAAAAKRSGSTATRIGRASGGPSNGASMDQGRVGAHNAQTEPHISDAAGHLALPGIGGGAVKLFDGNAVSSFALASVGSAAGGCTTISVFGLRPDTAGCVEREM